MTTLYYLKWREWKPYRKLNETGQLLVKQASFKTPRARDNFLKRRKTRDEYEDVLGVWQTIGTDPTTAHAKSEAA